MSREQEPKKEFKSVELTDSEWETVLVGLRFGVNESTGEEEEQRFRRVIKKIEQDLGK